MLQSDKKTRDIIAKYFDIGVDATDSLLGQLETCHLPGGEWLFRQGDPGDSFYFLVWGRLQVLLLPESSGAPDAPEILGEVTPGDSVGEISLLTGERRTASIRALRDSLLIRVDRAAFERLAKDHPELVMRLAGSVASVLHKRTSREPAASRNIKTVAILSLDDSPSIREFSHKLVASLQTWGDVLMLTADKLGDSGAPVNSLEDQQQVPDALKHWLHEREGDTRFLMFDCGKPGSCWSQFALRQSDLILVVADSDSRAGGESIDQLKGLNGDTSMARRMLVLLQPAAAGCISGTASWLERVKPDNHLHVRASQFRDIDRVSRVISGNAVGLVLGGGAARAIAHVGVIKALKELDIPIDWLGGTSMGAIMAMGPARDWDPDRTYATAKRALVKDRPFTDYTLPLVSAVSGARMDRILKREFEGLIEDLPLPFFCISCNLDSGALNVHESGSLAQAVRASAALPGVFPPAVVNEQLVVDGSVINNLPVDVMLQKPVGKIIAVDVSSQKQYKVPYEKVPSAWSVLAARMLPGVKKHRVPGLTTIILKATELGSLARVREAAEQADLLLNPPVRRFGMTQVDAFDEIVETSYEYAKVELEAWLKRSSEQKNTE